jgi:hypothetical protein
VVVGPHSAPSANAVRSARTKISAMIRKTTQRAQAKLRAAPLKKEKILKKTKPKKITKKGSILKRSPKPVSSEIVAIRPFTLNEPTKTQGD